MDPFGAAESQTMRALIMLALSLALVTAAGCGGSKKAAGEPCTATGSGAAECESGVCLKNIQCANNKVIQTACAGNDCSTGTCSDEMTCLPITGTSQAFCLPPTICQ